MPPGSRSGRARSTAASTLRVVYPGDRIRSGSSAARASTQLRVRDDGTFGDHDQYQHGRHGPPTTGRKGRRVTIADGSGSASTPAPTCVVRVPTGAGSRSTSRSGSVTVTNVDGELAGRRPQRAGHRHRGQGHAQRGRGRRATCGSPRRRATLSVDTGSGAVEVTGFQGTALSIDTGSGDVTGSDLVSDELSVDTGSGEIELDRRDVAAPLARDRERRHHAPTSGATIASLAGGDRLGRHRDPRPGDARRGGRDRDLQRRHRDRFSAAGHPAEPGSHGGDDRGREGNDRDRDRVRRHQAAEESN